MNLSIVRHHELRCSREHHLNIISVQEVHADIEPGIEIHLTNQRHRHIWTIPLAADCDLSHDVVCSPGVGKQRDGCSEMRKRAGNGMDSLPCTSCETAYFGRESKYVDSKIRLLAIANN